MHPCFTHLSISTLAAGTPITAVPAMFAAARTRAQAAGVTGAMVFDGAGFCVLFEGASAAVLRCFEEQRRDVRATDAMAVQHGPCAAPRHRAFLSGYSSADDLPPSEQLRGLEGEAALDRYRALSAEFDFG